MKTKKTTILITVLAILGLNACWVSNNNNLRSLEILTEEETIPALLGISRIGKIFFVNSNNGDIISPCIRQDGYVKSTNAKTNAKPCQTIIKIENGQEVLFKNGKKLKPLASGSFNWVVYEGSFCITKTTASGEQYEKCYGI